MKLALFMISEENRERELNYGNLDNVIEGG
jgi:hypothetical protein